MEVIHNRYALQPFANSRLNSYKMADTMRRLSSGSRLNRPGDGPAEFGISEHYRFQISNSEIAKRNMTNGQSMINTADNWLQQVQDILGRMSELSTGAIDGSKSQGDRESLNFEFMQLKDEISRIASEAAYNGLNIAGCDQMLVYDNDKETFMLSQLDGSQTYTLPHKILSGLKSNNDLDFLFDPTHDYAMSATGEHIFYVDSNDDLVKYTIESNELSRDDTYTSQAKELRVDDAGRLWYAVEEATGDYTLRLEDIGTWSEDTTSSISGQIVDMEAGVFSIYQNEVYYLDTDNSLVTRSTLDPVDKNVLMTESEITAALGSALNTSQFTISNDGMYLVDVPTGTPQNEVRVLNLETEKVATFEVGPPSGTGTIDISDINLSVDANTIAFVATNNTTTKESIYSLDLQLGDQPKITNQTMLRTGSINDAFAGLSLQGGSNRANFRVHDGPNAVQESFIVAGDVRLVTLGISRNTISSIKKAQDALGQVNDAIDIVSKQRAKLGGEYQRLTRSHEALVSYSDQISMAESRLSDADIAEESALLARDQLLYNTDLSMLIRSSEIASTTIQLLRL